MENEEFNKELLKIWEKHKDNVKIKTYPLFLPEFRENCILFIGINPSFSDKRFDRIAKTNGIKLTKEDLKYPNKEKEDWIIQEAIKGEKAAKDKLDYFSKFRKIAEEIKQEWEHLDLFFFRETSQNEAKKIIEYKKKNGIIKMNDFGKKQLRLFLETIKKLHPKIIVVSNALASDILRDEWGIKKLNLDNKEGFQKVDNTPVFFSGMLTGQRALDNGSYERLVWHINRALISVK